MSASFDITITPNRIVEFKKKKYTEDVGFCRLPIVIKTFPKTVNIKVTAKNSTQFEIILNITEKGVIITDTGKKVVQYIFNYTMSDGFVKDVNDYGSIRYTFKNSLFTFYGGKTEGEEQFSKENCMLTMSVIK